MNEAGSGVADPEAPRLDPTRTVRIDPHLHTAASYDGYTTPEQLLQRASAVGLDGVVATDHDSTEGAHAVARLAEEHDVLAIVGCEISTAEGHLLAIGVDDAPPTGRSLAETARAVASSGGVTVVPHPFQRTRHGAGRAAIDDVDGIEVYNAHTLTNVRNTQAEAFADDRGYPAFAGSDAHRPAGVGRAATAVELPASADFTEAAVLSAMRSGRTAAIKRRVNRWQYLQKMLDSATRKTLSLL